MRRLAVLTAALAIPAAAHVFSVSRSFVEVKGTTVTLAVHVPLYEMAHLDARSRILPAHFDFSSGESAGVREESSCSELRTDNEFRCTALYRFPSPVETLKVESRLPRVLAAGHVHFMNATREGRTETSVFDSSSSARVLRFRDPSFGERALASFGFGAAEPFRSPLRLLLLLTVALAARARREALIVGAAFLAGEAVGAVAAGALNLTANGIFLESAAALSIAYLAVEILFFSAAESRWAVTGVLGGIQGWALAVLNTAGETSLAFVLSGAAIVQAALIAPLVWVWLRTRRRPVEIGLAALLLAVGGVWFVMRLIPA
ncbi:MAG: hypothetical protein FJW40_10245 [Acidobacteria bacterium]|nr:hypothetical protein [Acidobacteriota bacterium]